MSTPQARAREQKRLARQGLAVMRTIARGTYCKMDFTTRYE